MAGNITTTESNRLLDAVLGTAAYTAPTTPIKVALVSANGSNSAAGTEVTGGSYARQTVTFSAAAAEAAISNLLARWTALPATIVAGLELWDSAGTPRRLWWGPLTNTAYSVVASTDVFTATAHGMANNDPVQFLTGQAPTGLTANTTYYVITSTTNTFQLSATVGGSSVNVTADGSGTFTKCKNVVSGDALEIASTALTVGLS